MSKFVILGGDKLQGEVEIQGSKNAAFPVIAATLLTSGPCIIDNVPDISDVRNFLRILEFLGADFEFENHKLTINTSRVSNQVLESELVGKLRGSVVLAGALLGRFGKVKTAYPGGDAIGSRPIDVHLRGFEKLGAKVIERGDYIDISADRLVGTRIVLGVTSVTGTENLILASVKAEGITEIRLAATEPHVQNLCNFLNKMGAKIQGIGTPFLEIAGVKELHPTFFTLGPDEIVATTFCVAAAATKGHVLIKNVDLNNLDAPLSTLQRMGVELEVSGSCIEIKEPAKPYIGTKLVTGVSPQLLTDEQPLFGVLATQAVGETSIHDWIYEGRQGYLQALREMGAKVEFEDAHRARIYGPRELQGTEIKTPDLRAGASILLAALVAKGQSIIYNAEIIDRGYEKLDEKLRSLGARIERIE